MAFQERSYSARNPNNIDTSAIITTRIVEWHVVAALMIHIMYLEMFLEMKSIVF